MFKLKVNLYISSNSPVFYVNIPQEKLRDSCQRDGNSNGCKKKFGKSVG